MSAVADVERVQGRATKVLDTRVFGHRVGFSWLWPFATITMTVDHVRLSALWSSLDTDDRSVNRGEVGRVCRATDYRRASLTSVVFQFADGSFWRYQLGPPKKVLAVLERRGWPVDWSGLISSAASYEEARIPA